MRKISPTKSFDTRTVQPVASRYNDYVILALRIQVGAENIPQRPEQLWAPRTLGGSTPEVKQPS